MATGLKGQMVETIIARFFGDIGRWPTEPSVHCFTQDNIRRVAAHMAETGDCLWHAQHIVMGWNDCHCAKCKPFPKI